MSFSWHLATVSCVRDRSLVVIPKVPLLTRVNRLAGLLDISYLPLLPRSWKKEGGGSSMTISCEAHAGGATLHPYTY